MPSIGERALGWEGTWIKRAGAAGVIGSLLGLFGFVLLQATINGSTNFEGLREAHGASGVLLAGASSGLGYFLLIGPLYLLFKAALRRSPKMRAQLVGIVILGPLLLGVSAILLAVGTGQAADKYVTGSPESTLTAKEAAKECREERQDKGKSFGEDFEGTAGQSPMQACESQKHEEDKASNAIKDTALITIGTFAGLAGALALVIALFYTGLWSLRTGLLSRFWGSLGMAVGIAVLIGFTPLGFLWFFYLGLLFIGILPGGLPPAWAAGEAVPWPTPGDKAAKELEGEPDGVAEDEQLPPGPSEDEPRSADRPRKRKQRD